MLAWLQLALLILKLANVITWAWAVVLIPLYLIILIQFAYAALLGVAAWFELKDSR